MKKEVEYKMKMNSDGSFAHLELWQDGQHIEVSLAGEGTHKNGWRWSEIKAVVDSLQNTLTQEAAKGITHEDNKAT